MVSAKIMWLFILVYMLHRRKEKEKEKEKRKTVEDRVKREIPTCRERKTKK